MKVPLFLVLVIVSEALVSSSGLPIIRHADLQQIARMILPYVTSRNRPNQNDFPVIIANGAGVGGHAATGKNRSYKADINNEDEDETAPVDIGLTDFEDDDLLTAGSALGRTITGNGGNYHDKRQFDDYGHMRFGRSDPAVVKKFDDYGHMRFGK